MITRSTRRWLRVGVVGAGNMGRGIALSLARSGHEVSQFDRSTESSQSSASQHDSIQSVESIGACCDGDAVLVSVSNEVAERAVFLGDDGIFASKAGLAVNLGTTSVAWARELHETARRGGWRFLDAPVSGGPEGAKNGTLSVMVGGSQQTYDEAGEVLDAISAARAKLGEAGAGAAAKLVNQLLVAANAHAAAEALALATSLGCDLAELTKLLEKAWGQSTMLSRSANQLLPLLRESDENVDDRAYAKLLDTGSAAPLRNFVKDVALVLQAADRARVDVPSARVAQRTLERCGALNHLGVDWAAVTPLLTKKPYNGISFQELEEATAPPRVPAEVSKRWREETRERAARAGPVPVIDDDPTGTQTVHSVSVLSYPWRDEDLRAEMTASSSPDKPPCFFVLANTRALDEPDAVNRAKEIGKSLRYHRPRAVFSRSDSTLRGHFPSEPKALAEGLGWRKPLVILAPYFFEGGRVTADDIHYVVTNNTTTPAADTEFAGDAAFGYSSSNLRDWVREKSGAGSESSSVAGIGLEVLRSPDAPLVVADLLVDFYENSNDAFPVVIANALCADDADALALGALYAQERIGDENGIIFRSAASLVAARCAVPKRELLSDEELRGRGRKGDEKRAGIVAVGSYVGKTTEQLDYLLDSARWLDRVEMDAALAADLSKRDAEIDRVGRVVQAALHAGKSAAIYTSRKIIREEDSGEKSQRTSSLEIGDRINDALCAVVGGAVESKKGEDVFVVAKGGITSNDVAVKSLGVRRAQVLGQVVPGVPAWRLGEETRAPGASYVVFPGNVGKIEDLATVVSKVAGRPLGSVARPRFQDLLLEAGAMGRAVGAFNVYNIEGALAVSAAVEKTGLPAIVQFHKASIDFGGASLVAACLEIADETKAAPMLVALDHAVDDATVDMALSAGVHAVMADGSRLDIRANEAWTAGVVGRARAAGAAVEAELGLLAGEEDGLSIDELDAKMTDPAIVADFVKATGIHALACTVGNVHGKYAKQPPVFDWSRLDAIRAEAPLDIPLVLHGASGIPEHMLHRAIHAGVCKFNVNTEVRAASRMAIKQSSSENRDILDTMQLNRDAMSAVIEAKLKSFASAPKSR